MVFRKLLSSAVFFLVVLTSTAALAEVRQGAVTVSPFVGGYLFEDDQSLRTNYFMEGTGPYNAPRRFFSDQTLRTNNFMAGIGLGYLITDHIGVEGIFGYIDAEEKANIRSIDPIGGETVVFVKGASIGRVNGYLYKIEGLYHFNPTGKFVPFVAAGVGGLTLDPVKGKGDSTVILDYGAGFQYFLSENLAFRADVRHVFELNEGAQNFMYTAGLTYYIGGGKSAQIPAAEEKK